MSDDDLSVIECPKCKKRAGEILNMETVIRVGWYCEHCKHFEKAILRERMFIPKKLNGKPVYDK
jgi:hypothetical protein